jgi:hypothetical protein
MAELTNDEIDAAIERGRLARADEPRASSVRYDKATRRVVIELTNGTRVEIPARLLQGLAQASADAIADVSVQGQGYGLRWDTLDVDLSVLGLLAGVFGTKSYMARRAGQTKSKAKAVAARRNGAKGGRPRKKKAA